MATGKMRKRVPPPPAEDVPSLSKDEMDQMVYRTITYGDIFRFRSMLTGLENYECYGSVDRQRGSRYSHENTVDFELTTDFNSATKAGTDYEPLSDQEIETMDALATTVQEQIDNIVTDICRQIYKSLEREYEYQTSDPVADDAIIANEYDFDEDGNRGGDLQFNELDDRAKEKAREWWKSGALDYEWWDGVFDDWKGWLQNSGFDRPEIAFSGFWSQGDGASFTCGSFDLDAFCNMLMDPATTQEKRLKG